MLWRIIGTIGGTTFILTAVQVISDPNCNTVDFSGGRAVTANCHPDFSGAYNSTVAGMFLLIAGLILLGFIYLPLWRNSQKKRVIDFQSENTKLMSSELNQDVDFSEEKTVSLKVCNSCKSIVPIFSGVCKNCEGRSFDYQKIIERKAGTSEELLANLFPSGEEVDSKKSETKLCQFCAEEIKFAAIKCKHCGEFLSK